VEGPLTASRRWNTGLGEVDESDEHLELFEVHVVGGDKQGVVRALAVAHSMLPELGAGMTASRSYFVVGSTVTF
jgi:hypothetical protein